MPITHKAIATTEKGVLEEIQLPTVQPKDDEVLVRVDYSSVVAFDTYQTDAGRLVEKYPLTLGLNASGVVAQIGSGVNNLNIGDRVATFGRGTYSSEKAMQEYALLPKYSVSKIPDSLPLPEAATIPDNFVTAYWVLFDSLRLPLPSSVPATSPPPEASTPVLIYGSGTTAGQFLIQLLRLAGYTRIFTTASPKHHESLKSLGATDIFDYSQPDFSDKILAANGGNVVKYAVDCVTAEASIQKVAKVVGKGSIVSLLLPIKNPFSKGVEIIGTRTFTFHQNTVIKETLMPKILPKLLVEGHIKPTRLRLIQDGTFKQRAETALELLRNNKVSGEKVVVKVRE